MTTETQIANLALSWMGQNLINALSDPQNEAKIMNANYDTSRDKVVADHAWTFALRREVLAPLATLPVFGRGNAFLIPSDVLRVFRVYRPSSSGPPTGLESAQKFQNASWVREGDKIIAQETTIWAHFIVRVTNSLLFNATTAHAIAARLAADTCMTFTENRGLTDKMEDLYIDKLADAVYADGSQGRTEIIRSTKLTGVRTR